MRKITIIKLTAPVNITNRHQKYHSKCTAASSRVVQPECMLFLVKHIGVSYGTVPSCALAFMVYMYMKAKAQLGTFIFYGFIQ